LQELSSAIPTHNIATGDLDFIVEEHKKYAHGRPPVFINKENTTTS
jgi:hypothetical protein